MEEGVTAPNHITNVTVESLIYKLQDETLSDAARRLFSVGVIFDSKDILHRACLLFGSEWGFHIQCNARKMCCNRNTAYVAKKDGAQQEKQRNHKNSIKVGCKFHIKFKQLKGSNNVQVNDGVYEHSTELGCIPSASNLVIVKKASGHYSKIEPPAMKHFLEMLQHGSLTPNIMRNIFKSLLPCNVPITGQFIVNMRMKAARYLPQWKVSNSISMKDYNDMTMYTGLDNKPEFNHDKATVMATEVMQEILNEGDLPSTITTYLSRLHGVDNSFKYRLAKDEDSNTLIGVIWQNATMRSMFEDYGDVLFTDVMKRQTNSIRWPYISFTVLDSMKKTHVVVEGIVCGEYLFAYKWVLKSLLEMTPKKDKDTISIIFADQFLNESVLDGLGFQNDPLVAIDYFHMVDSILPQQFTRVIFNSVKIDLVKLLNADSEDDFNTTLASLKSMLGHNQSHLRKLEQLSLTRKKFAKYELFNHKGSLQRRGNAPAEGNHASYLAVIGRKLTEDPVVAISKMIERENDLVNSKNLLLAQYKQSTITYPNCGPHFLDIMERDAKQYLSSWGFELFLQELVISQEYLYDSIIDDNVSYFKVKKKDPKIKSFRLIVCGNRCPCETVVSFGIMCRHEIITVKCFKPEYFMDRWKIVEVVRLSKSSSIDTTGTIFENSIDGRNNMFHTESTLEHSVPSNPRPTHTVNEKSVLESLSNVSRTESVRHVDFKNVADNLFGLCQHNHCISKAVYNVLCGLQRTLVTGSSGNTNDVLSSLDEGYQMFTTTISSTVSSNTMPIDPVPFKADRTTPQKRIKSPGERVNCSRRSFSSIEHDKSPDVRTKSSKRPFSQVEQVSDIGQPYEVTTSKRSSSLVGHVGAIVPPVTKKCRRSTTSAKMNFNVASTTEFSDLVTYKKVSKVYRNCSFCHIKGHKNQDTSPCPMLSHHGLKLDKKLVNIIEECQKEVFVIDNKGTPMQLLDTLVTEHVVIHSFVVVGGCEVNVVDKVSTSHSFSDILTLVTLLDKNINPVKNCSGILLTINCLMKWINVSKKFSLVIDGRVKWKHRSVQDIVLQPLEQSVSNKDVNSDDSGDELLRRVNNLHDNRSRKLLEIDDDIDCFQSDNSSCQILSMNSDDDSKVSWCRRLEGMESRSRRASNIDEMLEYTSGSDQYYSDDDFYEPVKPYIYIYETSSEHINKPVTLTTKRNDLEPSSIVPFQFSDSKRLSDTESPTQFVDYSTSPSHFLSEWGIYIPNKSMVLVEQMSDVMNLRICWCDLRNPEKQHLTDDYLSHLVIHCFFKDRRQDKSLHHLFNDKLCIATMLNSDGRRIPEYSFIVVRIDTIAGWVDSHQSNEHVLIDGMDIEVDWSKIRYFSQPQPRCVYSIFSFKLDDNTSMDTVSVASYIAMLKIQLENVDTSEKDQYWSDRMTIIVPTNVIDIVSRPRAQISPGDTLLYSYKNMFYDTTTLLMSKVMIIDENPPIHQSHLFIKLQNDIYLTSDDIVMKINPETNEALSTWLSLGMIKIYEWQKCDVVGGKVVEKGAHLKRKAHRAFIRGCRRQSVK